MYYVIIKEGRGSEFGIGILSVFNSIENLVLNIFQYSILFQYLVFIEDTQKMICCFYRIFLSQQHLFIIPIHDLTIFFFQFLVWINFFFLVKWKQIHWLPILNRSPWELLIRLANRAMFSLFWPICCQLSFFFHSQKCINFCAFNFSWASFWYTWASIPYHVSLSCVLRNILF